MKIANGVHERYHCVILIVQFCWVSMYLAEFRFFWSDKVDTRTQDLQAERKLGSTIMPNA